MTIVRTHDRYKRAPRKKPKAVALAVPQIVTAKQPKRSDAPVQRLGNAAPPADAAAPEPTGAAIVTARKPGKRTVDVPDMTPEEQG